MMTHPTSPNLVQLDEIRRLARTTVQDWLDHDEDGDRTPSEMVKADPGVKCTWSDWDLFCKAMLPPPPQGDSTAAARPGSGELRTP